MASSKKLSLCALVLVLGFACASTPALAEELSYAIEMSSLDVIPPVEPEVTGIALLGLDAETMQIDGDVIVPVAGFGYDVHLHAGLPGENGPLLGTFELLLGATFFRLALDQASLDAIFAGEAYLLVTLPEYPDGICRGQFPPLVVPNGERSVSELKIPWRVND